MESTVMILKPDAVEANIIGKVLSRIESDGMQVKRLRMQNLTEDQATEFYAEHEGKEFYERLINFMVSGPVVTAVIEGVNAISRLRKLMGATVPEEAAPGTIRGEYGTGSPQNIIHGSDSPESAAREIQFFFDREEKTDE